MTATMQKQTRLMLPTRTAKAFKPLQQLLEDLESGKALTKERQEILETNLTGLLTYAVHQEEKEASGEEMYLPRLNDAANITEDMGKRVEKLSKTYPALKEVPTVIHSIAKKLKVIAEKYAQRAPKAGSEPPVKAEPVKKVEGIEVTTVGNAIKIGDYIIHDRALAMSILCR